MNDKKTTRIDHGSVFLVPPSRVDRLIRKCASATHSSRFAITEEIENLCKKAGVSPKGLVPRKGAKRIRSYSWQELEIMSTGMNVTPWHFLSSPEFREERICKLKFSCHEFSGYSAGFCYWLPKYGIAGAEEIDILFIELPAHHSTKVEQHLGEEFFIVVEGEVEIEFCGRSVRQTLGKHEGAHYSSCQPHVIHNNCDGVACLFGVRQRLPLGTDEQHALVDRPELCLDCTDEIVDVAGLSRLLDRQMKVIGKSVRGLSEANGDNKDRLNRLLRGHRRTVSVSEMEEIGRLVGLPPVLLYDYLTPMHLDLLCLPAGMWRDMSTSFSHNHNGEVHRIPVGRLAGSRLTMALIDLPVGSSTPMNLHAGFEILVPLAGCLVLEADDVSVEIDTNHVVHFRSDVRHRVSNQSNEIGKFLVVRHQ